MSTRFKMGKVQPAAYKAMDALDNYVSNSGIDKIHQELIRIRASQINGCAYCVNYHSGDARKLGETEQRLYLISVWREAKNVFTEEEQLLSFRELLKPKIHLGNTLREELFYNIIDASLQENKVNNYNTSRADLVKDVKAKANGLMEKLNKN